MGERPSQDISVILRSSGLVGKYTGHLSPIKAYMVPVLPVLGARRRQVEVKLALPWGRGEWLLVKLVLDLISCSSTLFLPLQQTSACCLAISNRS